MQLYSPHWAAFRLLALAQAVHAPDPPSAAEFLFLALPSAASLVLLLSAATAAVIWWSGRDGAEASAARAVLFAGIAIDLLVRAAGVNPVMNPLYLAEPQWTASLKADPDARFYVGGKHVGGFDRKDFRGARRPSSIAPALTRVEKLRRGDCRSELCAIPPGGPARLLTTDVAALWPREFELMTRRFLTAPPDERDRLLNRSAVRYRDAAGSPRRRPHADRAAGAACRRRTCMTLGHGRGAARLRSSPPPHSCRRCRAASDALFDEGMGSSRHRDDRTGDRRRRRHPSARATGRTGHQRHRQSCDRERQRRRRRRLPGDA